MAKGNGGAFNAKNTGNIPDAPSNSGDPSRKWAGSKHTINDEAVRTSVTKNPSGERSA